MKRCNECGCECEPEPEMLAQNKELQNHFAGFDLCGWRQDDGTYLSHDGTTKLESFPESIHVFGKTFTLEDLQEGATNEKGTWVNAIYV